MDDFEPTDDVLMRLRHSDVLILSSCLCCNDVMLIDAPLGVNASIRDTCCNPVNSSVSHGNYLRYMGPYYFIHALLENLLNAHLLIKYQTLISLISELVCTCVHTNCTH